MDNVIDLLLIHYHQTDDLLLRSNILKVIRIIRRKNRLSVPCDKCRHSYKDTCQSRDTDSLFISEIIFPCRFFIHM